MKIRYGMVGGGEGSFIGSVHRQAASLDGEYQLVCGAFSADAARSQRSGLALGLSAERSYCDFTTMMQQEALRPVEERMQCVVIATPNHLHLPAARLALQHGFHVLSDKPATFDLAECRELASLVRTTGLLYGLTHPYIAYPMVQQARMLVAQGRLGTIHKIVVEYIQGWLSSPLEQSGNKQALWRVDPAQAGNSCCMGDIGVHAFNLAEFVSGLEVSQLRGELNRLIGGRQLDDDGVVSLHFNNQARGVLLASQVSTGEANNIRLRIYGDKAGLDWQQMEPNSLWLRAANQPAELFCTGTPYVGEAARWHTRIPAGHPEGYIEAFANIYRAFAGQIRAHALGHSVAIHAPGIEQALRGMAFIEAVVDSAERDEWLAFPVV